jgi:hypothetical protein
MHSKRTLMLLAGAILLASAFSTTAHIPDLSVAPSRIAGGAELAIVPDGGVRFVLETDAANTCLAEPALEAKTGICIADYFCDGSADTCCASWGQLRKFMTCCGSGATGCRKYCDPT